MAIDLTRLAQYDTPTICNTIELFEVRPRNQGYMDARIRACFPEMPPTVSYASTATMRCAFPRQEGDIYGSLDEQAAPFSTLPGPPTVVCNDLDGSLDEQAALFSTWRGPPIVGFQDLDGPAVAATFGEVMCSTYRAFGAA